jgi:hypothetical protein
MTTKRSKKLKPLKHYWVRARVVGNTGDCAFIETTSNNTITVVRGHSPNALDLFRDEFLAKLPCGRLMNVVEFSDGTCRFEFGRI